MPIAVGVPGRESNSVLLVWQAGALTPLCYATPEQSTSKLSISTRVMKPSHCAYHWFSHSSKTTLAAKPDSVAADVLQPVILYSIAKSIEWFIEDQAFSPPYDLVWLLRTPSPPGSKLDRRHTGRLRKRDNLLTWDGAGEGVGEELTTARKPFPL
jgi:hypothetical protein